MIPVPIFYSFTDDALYLFTVHENIFNSYEEDNISILKITKENNSSENIGGVTVCFLHIAW